MEVSKRTWHYWLWSKSRNGRYDGKPKDVCQYVRGMFGGVFNIFMTFVMNTSLIAFGAACITLLFALPISAIIQLFVDGSILHFYKTSGFDGAAGLLWLSGIIWVIVASAVTLLGSIFGIVTLFRNRDRNDSVLSLWLKGKKDKVCYKIDVVDWWTTTATNFLI